MVNERAGVSILSENTGAHEELGEYALSVNPFDIQELADSIHAALTMEPAERAAAHGTGSSRSSPRATRATGSTSSSPTSARRPRRGAERSPEPRLAQPIANSAVVALAAASLPAPPPPPGAGAATGAAPVGSGAADAPARRARPRAPAAATAAPCARLPARSARLAPSRRASGLRRPACPPPRAPRSPAAGASARSRPAPAPPEPSAAGAAPRPRARSRSAGPTGTRERAVAGRSGARRGRAGPPGRSGGDVVARGRGRGGRGGSRAYGRPRRPGGRSRPRWYSAPPQSDRHGPASAHLRPHGPALHLGGGRAPRENPRRRRADDRRQRRRRSSSSRTGACADSRSRSTHTADAEYHLLQFSGPPALVETLSYNLKITDGVVRHRIIKVTPGTPAAAGADGAGARRAAAVAEPSAEPAAAGAEA